MEQKKNTLPTNTVTIIVKSVGTRGGSISLLMDELEFFKFAKTISEHIGELYNYEVLIGIISARKKYNTDEYGISRSVEMLEKMVLKTIDPLKFLLKIRKYARVEYAYIDNQTEKFINPNNMAMYIELNPRNVLKAYNLFVSNINDRLIQALSGSQVCCPHKKENCLNLQNIDSILFSALAKSKSRKIFYIIDIDEKISEYVDLIVAELGKDVVWVSETRGGYHIISNIVDAKKVVFLEMDKKTREKKIYCVKTKDKERWELDVDAKVVEVIHYQAQTPVVGTLQGGFLVRQFK